MVKCICVGICDAAVISGEPERKTVKERNDMIGKQWASLFGAEFLILLHVED